MKQIKALLPRNKKDFIAGNGEGVLIIIDNLTETAYENKAEEYIAKATLDSDSVFFPGMKRGTDVEIELRGENKPVIVLPHYKTQYYELDEDTQTVKRAKSVYARKKKIYHSMNVLFRKELIDKDTIKLEAARRGLPINAFITEAILEKIERERNGK